MAGRWRCGAGGIAVWRDSAPGKEGGGAGAGGGVPGIALGGTSEKGAVWGDAVEEVVGFQGEFCGGLQGHHLSDDYSAGVDYDAVLDAEFGPIGTTKREVYEMRACRAYVSFAIKQARLASGIPVEEFEVKMGLKTGRSNLSNVERRSRVLPLDYLAKVMSSLGMRAVIVRPGLVNWNPISRTHTMEQMLTEIGEQVYRWKRKEVVE